jgi:Zn-dependent M16 (insulinase) family peptidase
LAEILEHQDKTERSEIRSASARLETRQDGPQNAEILPKVTLADVPRRLPEISGESSTVGAAVVHHYAAATNGLLYLQLVFDLPDLDETELVQLPLFCEYLTELGTVQEDYLQTQARRAMVGNITAYASARTSLDDIDLLHGRLVVTAKGLRRKREGLIENLFEVLDSVRFDESPRLLDLLSQSRVDAEDSITDRGHMLAMQGASRSLSTGGFLDDLWEGPASISFVQGIERECRADEEALAALTRSFVSIRGKVLAAPWRILVVGEEDVVAESLVSLESASRIPRSKDGFAPITVRHPGDKGNCAWLTNTQVNFCARAYRAVTEGHTDAAALSVLAKFLTDGYLHPAIREKGGAYGAGSQFDAESATFRFFSYRDPRLTETLDDFERSSDWLDVSKDAQRLEESILGVIRGLDYPRPPAGAAIHSFYDEQDHRTAAFRTAFRDAVLNTTYEDVHGVAHKYLNEQNVATTVITHSAHQSEIEQLHLEEMKL